VIRCTWCGAFLSKAPSESDRGVNVWYCARCGGYHDDTDTPGTPNQNPPKE
jgi:hypothetical protein